MGADRHGVDKDLLAPPPPFQRRAAGDHVIHEDSRADEKLVHALSVARGLSNQPRWLDFRYLYDDEGAFVFERITEQPEYYQTRTEDRILADSARAIRERVGDVTLVELGSGSSQKTLRLLDAFTARGPSRYIPIDISPSLPGACTALATRYPNLRVEGIAAAYDRGISIVAAASPLCLLFLGSSIGNFGPVERNHFLSHVADHLSPGDYFLVGIDLVKDSARLEAAYNDAAGWTARFTRNLFLRMNRDFGASIPDDAVEHVAYYNERLDRIEIYGRFLREVTIDLPLIARSHRIAAGEMVLAEISCKYRPDEFAAEAGSFGLSLEETYRDAEGLFAVQLFRRRPRGGPGSGASGTPGDQRARAASLLHRVRARTLELIAPLGDDELRRQDNPVMGPIAWDLGHIASFERLWLLRRLEQGGAAVTDDEESGEALDPIFDPIANPRPVRARLPLPSRTEALALLEGTRAAALARLAEIPLSPSQPLIEGGYVWAMTAQHEAQHQETILAALQMLRDHRYDPPSRELPPEASGTHPMCARVCIPAGPFTLGTDDRSVAYDNERPRHELHLPTYFLDVAPVTNGEYLRFIEGGGYERRELWSDEGWRFVRESGARAPLHWVKDDAWMARRFGRREPVQPSEPVVHVSWFEAEAYARSVGKRLPTEAEWEKAAAWDAERLAARVYPWGGEPPTRDHANLDQRIFQPATVFAYPRGQSFYGCHQMLGDVWEWTSSWFGPYPGFAAFPYRSYSEIHFGERYRVLRGGSWATDRAAIRCTFRNWDYPERRQIFAGIRCASDE